MKLSDYVFRVVEAAGVKHVFMVPGGGAMHLNDSLGNAAGLTFVTNMHEQASAIAAENYAKATNNLGVALVTTGPGGTNAVTGVAGAWLDSTPCLVISGQVKRADLMTGLGVRNLGVQELDIVSIIRSITKYAVTVTDPTTIRFHLEKAIHVARTGRPGPCWIDIPLDVQAATVDAGRLPGFAPDPAPAPSIEEHVAQAIALLNAAERPVVLGGNGIRLARAEKPFLEMIDALGIPVLMTWLAPDIVPDDHPLSIGRPGSVAPRGSNFALQNSDVLLSIGARLDLVITGYSHAGFARGARKIMVDIDPAEIRKMKTRIEVPICADARDFIEAMLRRRGSLRPAATHAAWLARGKAWLAKYPIVLPEYRSQRGSVSTYVLAETLSALLGPSDNIVSGSSGAAIEIFILAFKFKAGQRLFHTTALGAMGFGLPAAIGACLGSGGRRTVCVEGDGSLQLNSQELSTIARLALPIKLFILNNDGYSSIRTSQTKYFQRCTGCDPASGLVLPDVRKLAAAHRLPVTFIDDHDDLPAKLRAVLDTPGPVVCDLKLPRDEVRAPSLASSPRPDGSMVSRPLEDLWPFLDREEFRSNMIIPPLPE